MQPKEFKKIEKEYKIGGGESNFMKLEEGDNIVRIISEFELRGVHQFKDQKGKFQTKICVGKDKNCLYCNADNKISVKYLCWAIDKKDNIIKILEIGHTIFKQLGIFQEDPDYMFEGIPDYDIKIRRTGKGLDTEYQVIPSPKRYQLDQKQQEEIMKTKPISDIIRAMKDKELKHIKEEFEPQEGKSAAIEEAGGLDIEEEVNIKDIPF